MTLRIVIPEGVTLRLDGGPRIRRVIPPGPPRSVAAKSSVWLDSDVAVRFRKMARCDGQQLSEFLTSMMGVYAKEKGWT